MQKNVEYLNPAWTLIHLAKHRDKIIVHLEHVPNQFRNKLDFAVRHILAKYPNRQVVFEYNHSQPKVAANNALHLAHSNQLKNDMLHYYHFVPNLRQAESLFARFVLNTTLRTTPLHHCLKSKYRNHVHVQAAQSIAYHAISAPRANPLY